MIVGRLFVALGIKGGKNAKKEVDSVTGALKETASSGLAAKAAIVGAMYALEQLASKSGQTGTNLTNFTATIGVSAQTLQRYQYAARQVGVSNEAVEGSFRSLQATVTNTLLNKGAPEGLARVIQMTKRVGDVLGRPIQLKEFAEDPSKLLQLLQQYAQVEKDAGLRNNVLKTFGIGDDMIAALTRNAFRPEVMAKAPTYSDEELARLDKANIAWSNLGNKIEMAIGHLNASHGGKLVTDISNVADQVLRCTDAFIHLAEKLQLFDKIGYVFESWAKIFGGIATGVDAIGDKKKGEAVKKDVGGFFSDMANLAKYRMGQLFGTDLGTDDRALDEVKRNEGIQENAPMEKSAPEKSGRVVPFPTRDGRTDARLRDRPNGWIDYREDDPRYARQVQDFKNRGIPISGWANKTPPVPRGAAAAANAAAPAAAPTTIQNQTNSTTVNQTVTFTNDGKNDHQQTARGMKQATQKALRESHAQAQGT